jgi:hypothetical protein
MTRAQGFKNWELETATRCIIEAKETDLRMFLKVDVLKVLDRTARLQAFRKFSSALRSNTVVTRLQVMDGAFGGVWRLRRARLVEFAFSVFTNLYR